MNTNAAETSNQQNYSEHIEPMPGEDGFDETKLVERITKRAAKSGGELADTFAEYQLNRRYYKGDQIDKKDLYVNETPIVVNRIFSAVETIIPVAAKATPEANVHAKPTNTRTLKIKAKVERELKDQWEIKQKMPLLIRKALRQWSMAGFWCAKVTWERKENEIKVVLMPPGKVVFPIGAVNERELPYVIEYVKTTLGDLKKNFPDSVEEINQKINGRDISDDSEITYEEYWEDEYYACKFKDIYLYAERNPNWNYEDSSFTITTKKGTKKPVNHLKYPQHPYVFGSIYNLGESIIDEVTLIGVARSLQDAINKRKRQIEVNADQANGQIVVAGQRISKEGVTAMRNAPGAILVLDKSDTTTGAIEKLEGVSFPQGTYTDMQDSKGEMDAMMGTNSNLRGERESQETATGRTILKQSDTDRIGGSISVAIEDFAARVYDQILQQMYVHYEEKRAILSLPEGKQYELSEIDKENYIDRQEFVDLSLSVLVNPGSTIPVDPNIKRAEAIDLAKAGMMSLLDMYRIMGYPNPDKLAFNAAMEKQDPTMLYTSLMEPENYSVEAVEHLLAILDGEDALSMVYSGDTVEGWTAYTKTNNNYLRGVEIDENLIPYHSLELDTQVEVTAHIQDALTRMHQFMATQPLPPVAPETSQEQLQDQPLPETVSPIEQGGIDANAMAGQPPALPQEQPLEPMAGM